MQGVQGSAGGRGDAYAVRVLELQYEDAERQGAAATELIDAVRQVHASGKGGNAPGVGGRVDVSA